MDLAAAIPFKEWEDGDRAAIPHGDNGDDGLAGDDGRAGDDGELCLTVQFPNM